MHFAGGPKKYGYVCLPQVMGGPRHKLFFVYGGVVTNEHTKSSRPRGVLEGVFLVFTALGSIARLHHSGKKLYREARILGDARSYLPCPCHLKKKSQADTPARHDPVCWKGVSERPTCEKLSGLELARPTQRLQARGMHHISLH